ncbi:GGDEF domain-containing protein [Gallaecimonas mangrovi]|uniref:GGDEF domain-containing protein n=1 Tax=Gallaecimonas mangrovi TaxID=2291597 RepID=UPI001866F8B6|nr:GGDEF domain-containing protein [Gallaecimonas mangrovi]
MQYHPVKAQALNPQLVVTPKAEDVISLYQTLEPQQVIMRFAALAKHCLPLAGIFVHPDLRLQWRAGNTERYLTHDHPALEGIFYQLKGPLSLWQEQLLEHWHDALVPALTNALVHQQAINQARTDQLTGLGNRTAFAEVEQRLVARSDRHQHAFCLLLLDLDNFKPVNDVYGHQRGDSILFRVAHVMKAQARTEDLCFRLGGDEFAILLPDTDQEGAEALAERLLEALKSNDFLASHNIGVSMGLAQWQPGEHPRALQTRADAALYQAKDAGRGCLRKG